MTPQQDQPQPHDAGAQPPVQLTDLPESPRRPRSSNAELLALIVDNSAERTAFASKIVDAELYRDAFDQDWRAARVFAMSGVFKDITGTTQNEAIATAMTKIRLGRSWGIGEADSMQFIFFNNGRPGVMNELVASKMLDAGYDWDIEWMTAGEVGKGETGKGKCIGCRLWLKRLGKGGEFSPVLDRAGHPVSEAFSKEDADTAMIWEKGKQIRLSDKWNFQSWPKDMYFWRALGRVKKFHCTNILRGAVPVAELYDISDQQEISAPPPTEPERLTVQQKINKAEEVYEARVQASKQPKPAKPSEPSLQGEPEPSRPTETATPQPEQKAEESTQAIHQRPIIQLSGNELPDPFECSEDDRVRLADGTLCQIVEGGWKKIAEQPAAKAPSMALPKRK